MGAVIPLRSALAAVAALLLAMLWLAPAALAADAVTFGEPSATSSFGKQIEFKQPVTLDAAPGRVEILLTTPGAIGPSVVPVAGPTGGGSATLDYRVDLTDGHIVPNTPFSVRWRVTDASGKEWLGPIVKHTYADDRFTWRTLEGSVVHVHWTEGDQAFGRRALQIGDDAVAATAKLLGVTESDPIDFYIYPDETSFRAALGPATRENVGGQAHPDIRTLFALITPADIDASWVESVVPHELTHVVFATAVDNPYHDPPHWLNEGLAVYLSDGYADFDRTQVEQAAKDGSIIPLDGLAGAFPTTQERFFLAYAESVSAVDRIVRVDGRDALVRLIRSYAQGVSDDDAFTAALGRNVAGFETDWLSELGAKPPTRLGPKPAPGGPLPEGWSGPQPNPSFEVLGSAPPVPPSAPLPSTNGNPNGIAFYVGPIASLGLVVIVVLAIVAWRRIGRRPDPATWPQTGDNRLFGRPPAGDDPATGEAPPSRLWTTSDWSLPRDPDAAPAAGPATVGEAGETLPIDTAPADTMAAPRGSDAPDRTLPDPAFADPALPDAAPSDAPTRPSDADPGR